MRTKKFLSIYIYALALLAALVSAAVPCFAAKKTAEVYTPAENEPDSSQIEKALFTDETGEASNAEEGILQNEYNFVPLFMEGELTEYIACTIKGNVYIPLDALREYGDCSSFAIDEKKSRIYFEPADMDLFIADEETTAFIKSYAGTCYAVIKKIEEQPYVSLNMLRDFAGLYYSHNGSKGLGNDDYTDITRVDLSANGDMLQLARVKKDCAGAGSLFADSDDEVKLSKGDAVFLLDETRSFYKVRSFSGETVFLTKDCVIPCTRSELGLGYIYEPKEKKCFDRKFNLVWTSANTTGVTSIAPENTGIDVVSPVWMNQEVNGGGHVTQYGDRGFVDLCHERDMQVWICLNNSMTTSGSTNYTSKVLADETLRRKTIAQYLFYACLFDADGLNIDYEDVRTADGDNLTLFTAEMSEYAGRMGLVLSSDVLIPTPGNYAIYQYDKVAPLLDYVCAMTYDQHYSGSTYAGSVSSADWYRAAIEELLTYCPAEKLLMGIPFYTRVWTTDAQNRKLSVYAAVMLTARGKVVGSGLTPVWLPEAGQYYIEYSTSAGMVKIWLEDRRSIATRLSAVYEYGLPGSCCWMLGQQETDIPAVFEAIYKNGASPEEFNLPYLHSAE